MGSAQFYWGTAICQAPAQILTQWRQVLCLTDYILESPLDCKEIQPVHSEGDQPWYFFGRKDAKAETPVFWPPHAKSWLIGKDSDAGRDWGQEEKRTKEDEMAGWHHWLYRWTWVWVNSRSWWWTGRPGVLRFMRSQRVGHDWVTDLIWSDLCREIKMIIYFLFMLYLPFGFFY